MENVRDYSKEYQSDFNGFVKQLDTAVLIISAIPGLLAIPSSDNQSDSMDAAKYVAAQFDRILCDLELFVNREFTDDEIQYNLTYAEANPVVKNAVVIFKNIHMRMFIVVENNDHDWANLSVLQSTIFVAWIKFVNVLDRAFPGMCAKYITLISE